MHGAYYNNYIIIMTIGLTHAHAMAFSKIVSSCVPLTASQLLSVSLLIMERLFRVIMLLLQLQVTLLIFG